MSSMRRSKNKFATSSPMDSSTSGTSPSRGRNDTGDEGEDDTPGLSRISKNSGQARSFSKSRKEDRFQLSQSEGSTSDNEDEDSEDSQPSGRVKHFMYQDRGTMMTPARFRGGKFIDADCYVLEAENLFPKRVGFCGGLLSTIGVSIMAVLAVLFMMSFSQHIKDNNFFAESDATAGQEYWAKKLQVLGTNLTQLQKEFPGQNRKIWSVLKATMKSVMKKSPSQAAVILLVVDQGATREAERFVKAVRNIVGSILGGSPKPSIEEGGNFQSLTALYTSMFGSLNETAFFALMNVEKLSGSTAMALHAFCDNGNAPFKQAVIILSVNAHPDVASKDDEVAERVLKDAWLQDLDHDRISPLLSRITSNTIRIIKSTDENKTPES